MHVHERDITVRNLNPKAVSKIDKLIYQKVLYSDIAIHEVSTGCLCFNPD